LRIPGWLALGIGVVLLGIRLSVQSKAKKLAAMRRSATSKANSKKLHMTNPTVG